MVKNQQAGFTLIELVVVIVILGILSAVAAPRFIDLSSDARIAALEGLAGTLLSASNLVLAKANINGVVDQATANIDIDSDGINDVAIMFGYPTGDRTAGIANVIDLADDWAFGDNNGGTGGTEFYITSSDIAGFSGVTNNNIRIRSPNCYIAYIPSSTSGVLPTITFFTDDC